MFGKQADTGKIEYSSICQTFRMESRLGSGGSGAVYKAWHPRLRKYIVIKETDNCSTAVIEARRNEVEALKNIKNAYIPQVYDFLVEQKRCFTVMEYIEGESFDKILDRGMKFTEQQITKWYSMLASILAEIHAHGVYHRDIKPANIMLTSGGEVSLIDFNSALVSGAGARVISRSPGYASPEQLDHYRSFFTSCAGATVLYTNNAETELTPGDCITELTPVYDTLKCPVIDGVDWERSDIYSLGVTMHHLLTGVHPLSQAEKAASKTLPGKFNSELVSIIERSMRVDPSERFPTALHLYEALNKLKQSVTAAVNTGFIN